MTPASSGSMSSEKVARGGRSRYRNATPPVLQTKRRDSGRLPTLLPSAAGSCRERAVRAIHCRSAPARVRARSLPVPVDARRPLPPGREDLDAESIRIEDEERVVARDVAVLLGRVVDPIAPPRTPLMRRVHLLHGVDFEGQVLEPHAVVAMGPAVGRTD